MSHAVHSHPLKLPLGLCPLEGENPTGLKVRKSRSCSRNAVLTCSPLPALCCLPPSMPGLCHPVTNPSASTALECCNIIKVSIQKKKNQPSSYRNVFSAIPAGWLGCGFGVVVCSLHELLIKLGGDRSVNSSVDGIRNSDVVPSCSTARKTNILGGREKERPIVTAHRSPGEGARCFTCGALTCFVLIAVCRGHAIYEGGVMTGQS